MTSNLKRAGAWLRALPALVDRSFTRLAAHRRWCVGGIGLFALIVRLALLPILGVPAPGGHDEFSYLLLADTFAHGRLSNPTHPLWVFFESFHTIQQPTYSSVYPPAQGLVLAAGQLLGHPWIGELLVTALMCSAICWMLQGWLPAKWALYGATIALLRLAVLSYWMNGYWSASLVAVGGALLLGALPRIQRHHRIGDAFWLALGIAILANTRPYEGLVLVTIVGVALLLWMLGPSGPAARVSLGRIVAPAGAVLLVTALATGYFYYRVGGNPLRLTYQIDARIYNPVPAFLWQPPGPLPAYNHETMRHFYQRDLAEWLQHRAAFGDFTVYRLVHLYLLYLGPILAMLLLVVPFLRRDRGMRFALIAGALFFAALLGESWANPHYAAPATALLFLIVAQCGRRLAVLKLFRFRIGRVAAQAIPVLMAGALLASISWTDAQAAKEHSFYHGIPERAALTRELRARPGKHLVIVTYTPTHDVESEWVYNGADIDGADIVWARDMGEEKDRALLAYFRDRAIWTITVDDKAAPPPTPYPPGGD